VAKLEEERDRKVAQLEEEKDQIKWRKIPEDYGKTLIRYHDFKLI